ncbi:MAG: type II secretion system protein [Hydrogenophilales bacterium]|nr:type II secretion system protein [Hydrogenophilales bacterium]
MRSRGFTLIEMIVVIVLTSIIASAVAVFIKLPIEGYVATARRAEMTDIADTAIRRMGRDLRLALPNSVRVTDGGATIEILLTKTGGRYRSESDTTATADALNFSAADTLFDQFGPLSVLTGQAITINSDSVVIYNLGQGITSADAYAAAADNRSVIRGLPAGALANERRIQIDAKQFPLESPGNRFQVIEGPVSYVCANGQLTRYWGYPIQAAQPTAAALPTLGGASALLAANVGAGGCVFGYNPGITARSGLVDLTLIITQANESVRLYHEVHVTNVP